MSKMSWKKEFSPSYKRTIITLLDAAKHSLKKWIGLRSKNLKKHNICVVPDNYIECDECALCHVCNISSYSDLCGDHCCPLYDLGSCCGGASAYETYRETGNPEPMIEDLKKAIKILSKEKYKK